MQTSRYWRINHRCPCRDDIPGYLARDADVQCRRVDEERPFRFCLLQCVQRGYYAISIIVDSLYLG